MMASEPLTATELRQIFCELGACYPALVWMDQQITAEPDVATLTLWHRLVKMRRTPEELEYEKERRKEDPTYKSDPDTHTGWSWIAWVTHRAHMPCSNSTFSGLRKVNSGPNADAVAPLEVLNALQFRWGWTVRGEEKTDDAVQGS